MKVATCAVEQGASNAGLAVDRGRLASLGEFVTRRVTPRADRQRRFRWLSQAFLVVLPLLDVNAFSANVPKPARPVDFHRDVAPIFERSCMGCHGPDQQKGNLRLDRPEFAKVGGHTGNPILGGGENNAILQRVTSDDKAIRMPKGKPALTSAEIDVVRNWVQQGSPWPALPPPAGETSQLGKRRFAFSWGDLQFWHWNPLDWTDEGIDRFVKWQKQLAVPVLLLLVLLGISERCRTWVRQRQASGLGGSIAMPVRWLAAIRPSHVFALFLLLPIVAGAMYYQEQAHRADEWISKLQLEIQRQNQPELANPQDGVPRPRRPLHPPRLGGTYYRGNDERDARLYNGGFYRTAVMSVALLDGQGHKLEWGDSVSQFPLVVRFDIEQAPGATPLLFADTIWKGTLVSHLLPSDPVDQPQRQIVQFEKIAEGHWQANYELDVSSNGDQSIAGIIYLYRGKLNGNHIAGQPHYAAEYDLRIVDGRMEGKSQLWMGYTYKTPIVFAVPDGKIPEDEWFSFRPIPEIEGENTKDEHLLGIDDYRDQLKANSD